MGSLRAGKSAMGKTLMKRVRSLISGEKTTKIRELSVENCQ